MEKTRFYSRDIGWSDLVKSWGNSWGIFLSSEGQEGRLIAFHSHSITAAVKTLPPPPQGKWAVVSCWFIVNWMGTKEEGFALCLSSHTDPNHRRYSQVSIITAWRTKTKGKQTVQETYRPKNRVGIFQLRNGRPNLQGTGTSQPLQSGDVFCVILQRG